MDVAPGQPGTRRGPPDRPVIDIGGCVFTLEGVMGKLIW